MKFKFMLISVLMIFNSLCFAQSSTQREEIDREIQKIMKARNDLFRSLLDDNAFTQFDDDFGDRFNDLIKKFEQDNFGAMPNVEMGAVVGEYDWRETETHQILVIKVKQIKDRPLDIKIEKGFVRLKGDVEEVQASPSHKSKKISKVHFERSFSIPEGVDQTTPEFENKDGELLIKFKKLNATKHKSTKSHDGGAAVPDKGQPIGRDSDDTVI